MALTIYPSTDYDSFCSLADAEALILSNIPLAQHTEWDLLTDGAKEIELRQASLLIKNKITLPGTLDNDLKLATVYLANNSVGVTMTNEDRNSQVKSKEIVGVVKTEWFTSGKDSNAMPDIVNLLLAQYQITSTSSFSFNRA